ncbi:MAG: ExbD/TolR family protein [Pirellulales bacterium]
MRIRHRGGGDKIELQMTPMIDVVFQLNIFFLFTFKIVLPEGDFNVQMPSAAAARAAEPSEIPPLHLILRAAPTGELADLQLSGRSFGNGRDAFAQLQNYIRNDVVAGPGAADEQEVEIDADYNLNYDYVVKAITAVTGYVENGQPHKLIEKIKFTPPKQQ